MSEAERNRPLRIAVVGSGISGLSAAWLLARRHDVTLYERAERLGGHSNTVLVEEAGARRPVDTGFIVFNTPTYPNLTALFAHLGVETRDTDMSFSASLRGGKLEYSGNGLSGLFAQKRNLLAPRHWGMLRDLLRFYREAPADLGKLADPSLSLGDYLALKGYGAALRDDHLLPMAAAIWSTPARRMLDYPASAFVRFCTNHGLLQVRNRPIWRTVVGGSRTYVEKMAAQMPNVARLGRPVTAVERAEGFVRVRDAGGGVETYDHVVLACHGDEALALLKDVDGPEHALLSAFKYDTNLAVLHSDEELMPKRRSVWSAWNYMEQDGHLCVTYWMNKLQHIEGRPLFVTLNPPRPPRAGTLLHSELYAHPQFDAAAIRAQRAIWSLQGRRRTWYCGAHFGAGFHEDGLQSGLAVAEALGGVRRPWQVADENGRIHVTPVRIEGREWTA